MVQYIHHRKKPLSIILILVLVLQLVAPLPLQALTSGPAQPEFTGFTPVGTSDMVDLFTGNLNYTIPILEVPGPGGSYPISLSYQSGITMDQEASWVGLGWSLNAGAINRQMRGLPDEFKGDRLTTINDMKPNVTWDFGIAADFELIAKGKIKKFGSISLGQKFSHNSYKGWDAGLDLGFSITPYNMGGFGFTGGLSTSAIEGASLSGGFCYANEKDTYTTRFSLGTGFNSRQGLTDLSLGYSYSYDVPNKKGEEFSNSVGCGISFARRSFIPANDVRYHGETFHGSVEIGALLAIPHVGGRVNVGYSSQSIQRRGDKVQFPGFGYMHAKQRKTANTFLMDINRSNEGPLHRFTQNLATPNTTPDIYSVSGAGMNTIFRPYRSDVGIYSDPSISSVYSAANLGFDLNPTGYIDGGVNVGAQFSKSFNSFWPILGKSVQNFNFTKEIDNSRYRPAYFKVPGEMTSDSLQAHQFVHGDKTVRVGLNGIEIPPSSQLVPESGPSLPITQGSRLSGKKTATSVQHITNKELLTENGVTRTEYTAWIFDQGREMLDRLSDSAHHIAGFELLNEQGTRYIYALPVKNLEHREHLFSVAAPGNSCAYDVTVPSGSSVSYKIPDTDEFYQQKELPAYNHSHLLTAILGSDYADIDDIPGPSDGDVGFWVRLEYAKTNDYPWRAPYQNASYLRGRLVSTRDDKGSFMYGKREQYYLHVAETRTHRAEFITSPRPDARGAKNEVTGVDMGQNGEQSRKLDTINLFAKPDSPYDEVKALKRVAFSYINSLCPDAPNATGQGKLTLDKIQFSYEKSVEGMTTPYMFTYEANNPNYETRAQDRWGRFQPVVNECLSQEFPYSGQDSVQANLSATAWQLKTVKLPSGALINIQYEADDYLYVQDREVMQMFPIIQVNSGDSINKIDLDSLTYKAFFNPGTGYTINDKADFIPFLKNIHGLELDDEGNIVNGVESQVYFKVNMKIKEGLYDYVSGYARITGFGIEDSKPFIQFAPFRLAGKDYHPFSAAAWQKMKIEYPNIISIAEFEDDDQSFMEVMGLFIAGIDEISSAFRSFFSTCAKRKFATNINPDLSFIRLCYPGKGKFGGDSRVKKISLDDRWDGPLTLGQVYDYTMTDSTGVRYSSGVAENEPTIGYDECPLRYAKKYHGEIPVHTSDNLMFEYPINEAYYPSARIGYRQVTVRSLATAMNKEIESGLPANFSTTGRTVHEFYTAKDFPVIYDETSLDKHFPPTPIWNTVFASSQNQKYSGSQGYSITLNDMHGKPLRVTHYGEDKMNRELDVIINKTEYTYFEEDKGVTHELGKFRTFRRLENKLNGLAEFAPDPENSSSLHLTEMEFGVDREFFADLRYTNTIGGSLKAGPNVVLSVLVSIFGIPLPMPGFFATIGKSESTTKTAVTNKIITRTGILKQVDVYDGQSHLKTNNLVFDKVTGNPILTSVNNAFDDEIFSLTVPAHYAYEGMNAAYENYRMNFEAEITGTDDCTGWLVLDNIPNGLDALVKENDELLLSLDGMAIGTFIIQEIDESDIKGTSTMGTGTYDCVVLRSGARNMLAQGALQVTSLSDPTENLLINPEIQIAVATPDGPENTSIEPMLMNDVISARATTYGRIVSPLDEQCSIGIEDNYCACITAEVDCNGDCVAAAVLSYINTQGDTIELEVSNCFNCNTPTNAIIEFDCDMYDPSWVFIVEVVPSYCGSIGVGTDCSWEMDPDNITVTIEEVPCGREPGAPMDPIKHPLHLSSAVGGNHWVPKETYVYNQARSLTSLSPTIDLDLKQEGLVDKVPLFDFANPFFTQSAQTQQWIQSSGLLETGVTGNIEHEQNAIGTSSVLFRGYAEYASLSPLGNVPVLSVKDALPYEVAFEGFEEDNWEGMPPAFGHSTTNFTFGNDILSARREKYLILGGITGSPNEIALAKQFDSNDPLPSYMVMELKDDQGVDTRRITCDITAQDSFEISDYNANIILPYRFGTIYSVDWPAACPPLANLNAGDITLVSEIEYQSPSGDRSSVLAHTGQYSFLPGRQAQRIQSALNLTKGKEYILEAWINMEDTNHIQLPTYPDTGYILLVDGTNPYIARPVGKIIEGWQQVQVIFEATGGPISITFTYHVPPIDTRIYFDDLRISPLSSSIKSYVYDADKLRLSAELDENNFATFFSYDEEGKLVLVRKETERGIMTIRESRSHLHAQP